MAPSVVRAVCLRWYVALACVATAMAEFAPYWTWNETAVSVCTLAARLEPRGDAVSIRVQVMMGEEILDTYHLPDLTQTSRFEAAIGAYQTSMLLDLAQKQPSFDVYGLCYGCSFISHLVTEREPTCDYELSLDGRVTRRGRFGPGHPVHGHLAREGLAMFDALVFVSAFTFATDATVPRVGNDIRVETDIEKREDGHWNLRCTLWNAPSDAQVSFLTPQGGPKKRPLRVNPGNWAPGLRLVRHFRYRTENQTASRKVRCLVRVPGLPAYSFPIWPNPYRYSPVLVQHWMFGHLYGPERGSSEHVRDVLRAAHSLREEYVYRAEYVWDEVRNRTTGMIYLEPKPGYSGDPVVVDTEYAVPEGIRKEAERRELVRLVANSQWDKSRPSLDVQFIRRKASPRMDSFGYLALMVFLGLVLVAYLRLRRAEEREERAVDDAENTFRVPVHRR